MHGRWRIPSPNRRTGRWNLQAHQKADQEVAALVNTAAQIDPLVYSLQLNPQTTSQWEKLRTELHQIAQAFGVPEPYFAPQPGSLFGRPAPPEPASMLSVSSGRGSW
jgi:hypothetical protein